MTRFIGIFLSFGMLAFACFSGNVVSHGQSGKEQTEESVLVPDSAIEVAGDVGHRAHTNHLIMNGEPAGGLGPGGGLTPAQLRSFYGLGAAGNFTGRGLIVIVEAFHYSTALNDFNTFSAQFGLPQETSLDPLAPTNQVFQVVYATGKQPSENCGWAQEAAAGIEWAHAMAPGAKIVLVEAASNRFDDLFDAVDLASTLSSPYTKQVSMGWGGHEFPQETAHDFHFFQTNFVVYFAASGNHGGKTTYPSTSPYVVAVGGTSVQTDGSGNFVDETGWKHSGGGLSQHESRPAYQDGTFGIVGESRGLPDISSVADPNTGLSVYVSMPCKKKSGWLVFGGTAVSSPCLAGMANLAAHNYFNSTGLLTHAYQSQSTQFIRDILIGKAGRFSCMSGWDFVTGVGSPQGTSGL